MPSSSGGKDNVCQNAACADMAKIESSHDFVIVRQSSRGIVLRTGGRDAGASRGSA